MLKRKLQIFLSSTYEDLIDHRLAAMEAMLETGHIPAEMEQFSPGDEAAWERITRWIDESDAVESAARPWAVAPQQKRDRNGMFRQPSAQTTDPCSW